MNIADYIQSAKEGSQEAIAALFDEYKNTVWFLARSLTGETDDVDSVLQYTFYQAFHRINVLKKPENFGMWLNIITANRCRALLHDKHPMSFMQNDDAKAPKVKFSVANTPLDSAVALDPQACSQIAAICDRLPDQLRFCELLYFYSQMSTAQIAKITEYSEAKVKLNISRAEAQIKAELEAISHKYPALSSYNGAGELYTILSSCAERVEISDSFSSDIIATSVTLALSAPPANAEKSESGGDTDKSAKGEKASRKSASDDKFGDNPSDTREVESPIPAALSENAPIPEDEGQAPNSDDTQNVRADADKRAAIRNIVTIAVVLILAASIIIGSVVIIKNAANAVKAPINAEESTNETSAAPVSDDGAQVTEEPATDAATEPPVTEPATEAETEPVTEAETEPPVKIDEPSQPSQPSQPADELSMTKAQADAVFTSRDVGGAVTITGYISGGKEVDIPATIDGSPVTAIGYNAFKDNKNIVSVNIPSTVTEIGENAFNGCSSLTDVTFSPNLVKISTYAFYNCASLGSVKLPSTVSFAGASVFGQTKWISEQKNDFVVAGDGILFRYIGVDTDITVPANVKFITNAFYYNTAVKSITVQSGATELGIYAFCGCTKLTSITLPDTITAISKDAIFDNKALTEIYVKSGSFAEGWCKDNGFASLIKNY